MVVPVGFLWDLDLTNSPMSHVQSRPRVDEGREIPAVASLILHMVLGCATFIPIGFDYFVAPGHPLSFLAFWCVVVVSIEPTKG